MTDSRGQKISRFFGLNFWGHLRDSSWLGIYHAISGATLVILTLLFGRLLPRSVYGEYNFFLSIAEVLATMALAGFPTVIVQSVARKHDGILRKGVEEVFRWSVLSLCVCAGLAGYYFIERNITYTIALVIMGVCLPLYQAFSLSDYFLLGRKNYKTSSLLNSLATLIVAASVCAALLVKSTLLVLLMTYFIIRTIVEMGIYLWTLRAYPTRNETIEADAVPHAHVLSGFNLLTTFADQADSIFMFFILGPANLALYTFSIAAPELLKGTFKNQLTALLLPVFSNRSRTEVRQELRRGMLLIVIATAPIVALYIVVAPILFTYVLPAYKDAIGYSQLFSLSLLLVPVATLPITMLRSSVSERDRYYRFLIMAEVSQIILLLIGIKWLGVLGAVLAYFCARLFRLTYSSYLVWSA